MGSALLDDVATAAPEAAEAAREAGPSAQHGTLPSALPGSPVSVLRRQMAERVAAHRVRRVRPDVDTGIRGLTHPRNARSAKIAAAVAERYAQTQTYHDFLAAEAERAVQQANAAAEVAALNAQALAFAQQRLLDAIEQKDERSGEPGTAAEARRPASPAPQIEQESEAAQLLWPELEPEAHIALAEPRATRRKFQPPSRRKPPHSGRAMESPAVREAAADAAADLPDPALALAGGITIRLYQDETGMTRVTLDPPAPPSISLPMAAHLAARAQYEEEARLLDEEIAFRQEPVFDEPSGAPEALPANLIEFPRQLIAARKARPRLAEGPLLPEAEDVPGAGQLRIFEVEPTQIAVKPENDAYSQAAQWSTILLATQPPMDTLPSVAAESDAQQQEAAPRALAGIASLRRRMLATAINAGILGAACVAFVVIVFWTAAHVSSHGVIAPATGTGTARIFTGWSGIQSALPFATCAFLLLAAIYQALFFTLSTATPGMRVARIALCTFSDENPTRAAIRRRLPAMLLSVLPMGFGFLWAALDEERLSWHDRICGIYQRGY